VEAFSRLREPPEILGGPMLAIAALGLLVNAVGAIVLSRSGGDNLNMQGALRHVIADALGSVGTIAAGLTIVLTGWRYADPLAGVAIAAGSSRAPGHSCETRRTSYSKRHRAE
jgi:cobalt-zinc-cadmium efflux system protein